MMRYLIVAVFVISQSLAAEADFYVSPMGDDAGPGSFEMPFATLNRTKQAVRELKSKKMRGDIMICLRGGQYQLAEPLIWTPEDSGTGQQEIIYRAFPDEVPILTGTKTIHNWSKLQTSPEGASRQAEGKLWSAAIEKGWYFPYIFIEGKAYYHSVTPNTDNWLDWPLARYQNETLILPDEIHFQLPNFHDVRINYLPTPYTNGSIFSIRSRTVTTRPFA